MPSELPPFCAMAEVCYQGILKMTQEQRDYFKSKFTKDQWFILTRGMPW